MGQGSVGGKKGTGPVAGDGQRTTDNGRTALDGV